MEVEQLIKREINRYTLYQAEIDVGENWKEAISTILVGDNKAVFLKLRLSIIKSWLGLLNEDERFVIEKHLIQELEWPRIAYEFSQRWGEQFIRSERALVSYQTSAIKKIVAFLEYKKDWIFALFEDEVHESGILENMLISYTQKMRQKDSSGT